MMQNEENPQIFVFEKLEWEKVNERLKQFIITIVSLID